MSDWSFVIEMERLDEPWARLLRADMEYFSAFIGVELAKVLKRIKKVRGMKLKVPYASQLTETLDLLANSTEINFSELVEFKDKIMRYEIVHLEDKTILQVTMDTLFFDVWKSVGYNKMVSMMIPNSIMTKEGIMKRFESTIRQDYTKKYTMKEVNE